MTPALRTVIYPVKDLTRSRDLYAAVFGSPSMDAPYYVQFNVGDLEFGLDPNGHDKGMTGPLNYWHVSDIGDSLRRLVAAGASEDQAVTDVGGRLIASVTDPDGNVIGLLQQL